MRRLIVFLMVLVLALGSADALAKKKKRKKKRKKKASSSITVPVDVGIGPTANQWFGTIATDQQFHWGLKLDLAAIIDQKTIKANKHRIPKKYRGMASKMKEFVYRPFWYLPDSLLLSPKTENGQMFGVTLRPIGLGLSLLDSGFLKLSLSAGLVLTGAYMSNDLWMSDHGYDSDSMWFLRPGANVKATLLFKLSKSFLVSMGYDAYGYVPQTLGRDFWEEVGENLMEDSAWLNGQAFVMLHFRFPYTTTL
jgi:hypothetical protein